MKLFKEIITINHSYTIDEHIIFKNEEYQYIYDNEKERNDHIQQKQLEGFKSDEKVKINIGTLTNPNYVWIGIFHKQTQNKLKLK